MIEFSDHIPVHCVRIVHDLIDPVHRPAGHTGSCRDAVHDLLGAEPDCPGLNAVLRAVVRKALAEGVEVVGIKNGWRGLVQNKTVPLDLTAVSGILHRGGTILGTSRTNPYKDPEELKAVKANFAALNLDALIAIGGREVCENVAPLLESEEASIRNYAIEILGKTGDAALDLISSLCDSENSDIRIFALDSLGKIGVTGESHVQEKCAELLEDENVNVAAKPAETIGNIGDPTGVPVLAGKIETSPWVQSHIILSIANIGGEKAAEFFESTDPNDFSPEVRQHFNIAKIMVRNKNRENAK